MEGSQSWADSLASQKPALPELCPPAGRVGDTWPPGSSGFSISTLRCVFFEGGFKLQSSRPNVLWKEKGLSFPLVCFKCFEVEFQSPDW